MNLEGRGGSDSEWTAEEDKGRGARERRGIKKRFWIWLWEREDERRRRRRRRRVKAKNRIETSEWPRET
jgi:hypothetical protein